MLAFCSLRLGELRRIPAGKSFWIHLLDPKASCSSKPGTRIRAVLVQSPECGSAPVFPVGVEIDGEAVSVRRVGFGFIHNSASLEIPFHGLVITARATLRVVAQIVEIDHARETVRHGGIRGVYPTNTPQARITSGLMHLPTYRPCGGIRLIVYRALVVLPEPENSVPPGSDLRPELTAPRYVADQPELPHVSCQLDEYERGEIELLLKNSPAPLTSAVPASAPFSIATSMPPPTLTMVSPSVWSPQKPSSPGCKPGNPARPITL